MGACLLNSSVRHQNNSQLNLPFKRNESNLELMRIEIIFSIAGGKKFCPFTKRSTLNGMLQQYEQFE